MRRVEVRLAAAAGLCLFAAGCNDTRDLAPPDPATPWYPTVSASDASAAREEASGARAAGARSTTPPAGPDGTRAFGLPRDPALPVADPHPVVDPSHVYSLVELVDVAQRNNKQTRVAWELARQAAILVGISRSAYLPALTLSALGGYRRETTPEPNDVAQNGYIVSQAEAIFPTLTISYLLVDFGARDAAVRAARARSEAANVAFTAANQELILQVARAYFTLEAAQAQLAAAKTALDDADLLSQAASSKLGQGEGTVTDVDDTRRGVAQARYAIASAQSSREAARDSLLEALGLPPRTALRVQPLDSLPVPRGMTGTLDALMRDALRSRPDLLADLARLRADEAETARSRAALYPAVSLNVKGSGDLGRLAVAGYPAESFVAPEAGVYLDFEWTFYQGGAKANAVRLAQSREAQQLDTLQGGEDSAMREVASSYDELEAGLAEYDAAVALQTAALTSFASSADAFRKGVGTVTAADTAQSALDQANATLARTHAQVLASAAALAFATGQLTSAAALVPR